MSVAPPSARRSVERRRQRVEHVRDLEGDRLERGAREVGPRRAARDAGHEAARVGDPVRGAEPGERGDEVDAAGRVDLPRERLALGGRRDDAERRRAATGRRRRSRGSRPRARSRVRGGAVFSSPSGAARARVADVGEHEAAGAVGRLGLARREAAVAEERGLLVARDRRRSAAHAEQLGLADDVGRRARAAGSIARSMPNSSSSSSSQSRASRGRAAASATRSSRRSRARVPPVSFQSSQESTVPKASSAAGRSVRASSHSSLVAEKYGSGTSPVARADQLARAARGSARRCAGPARRSRGATGRPRRALPEDGRLALVRDPDRVELRRLDARVGAAPPRRRPSDARPDLAPDRARPSPAADSAARTRGSRGRRTRSSPSTTRQVVPVVPWSIARITRDGAEQPRSASARTARAGRRVEAAQRRASSGAGARPPRSIAHSRSRA